MSQRRNLVRITIDNRPLEVAAGLTILRAAEQNDIYIPTLCAHKDLTPFGGCRMCIVEVDKMRGFPTSCTTPVEDGMVIRTDTAQIQAERREILRLILSEHPSSCLVCDEREECGEYSHTIRKAGVTTGCRYCPNDGQCELHEVAERLGIREIGYPVYYRGLPVKKDDPFFDRDFNLCILCGRCVRMCQEVRTANTLVFKQRGRQVVIGPAFERTHREAGCEFCGACLSVCPTGALSEKARKWKGKADTEVISTCPFCGVGCQIRLQVKNGEVIGSLPADDPLINNGQLCVKGRFCIPETVNSYRRLRQPYRVHDGNRMNISWDAAIDLAAEKLAGVAPARFGMLVSANCSNEDLYVAQKFARVVMGSHNIDVSARRFYGHGFDGYVRLFRKSVPLADLRRASVILCLGLDAQFGRSVVGVELRKAASRGADVIAINAWHNNLSLVSRISLRTSPDSIPALLGDLVRQTGMKKAGAARVRAGSARAKPAGETERVAGMLRDASAPVILVGSEFLNCPDSPEILDAIAKLAHNIDAGILPLPAHNNLVGSLMMGAYSELLPGAIASADRAESEKLARQWGSRLLESPGGRKAWTLSAKKKLGVLYLIGEVPGSQLPPADFVIYQNPHPPDPLAGADLVLPAAASTETDGTTINGEGRIQKICQAVDPPGEALPDWLILSRIARKMGAQGFDFSTASQVRAEISGMVAGFKGVDKNKRDPRPFTCGAKMSGPGILLKKEAKAERRFPFRLYTSPPENWYRGFPLSEWVVGMRDLPIEGVLDISPVEARRAAISNGDRVVVTSPYFEGVWRARIVPGQPERILRATSMQGSPVGGNPLPVRIRKENV